jgi:hypothetical protein
MTIYLVMSGENGEGGVVLSAHRSFSGAKKFAAQVPALGRGWELYPPLDVDEKLRWTSGCDWLAIVTIELKR